MVNDSPEILSLTIPTAAECGSGHASLVGIVLWGESFRRAVRGLLPTFLPAVGYLRSPMAFTRGTMGLGHLFVQCVLLMAIMPSGAI